MIRFHDIFSIGPVWKLHEESGRKQRFAWQENHIRFEFDEFSDYTSGFEETLRLIEDIPDGASVTLWAGENAHEQTGLLLAVYLLRERDVCLSVVNTTECYAVLRPDYEILHTGGLSPEQLQVIYEQKENGMPLTNEQRKKAEAAWLSLAETKDTLRIFIDGRISGAPEDYFDSLIISYAGELHENQESYDFMPAMRLVGEVYGNLEQYTGDDFIEYRIRSLVEAGIFDKRVNPAYKRFYSIKLREEERERAR